MGGRPTDRPPRSIAAQELNKSKGTNRDSRGDRGTEDFPRIVPILDLVKAKHNDESDEYAKP
jgi:hypothetical protein